MTTDAVTHEVISDVQAFRALEPEWNALWHKAKGEHFQTFAYCHGSLDATVDGRKLQCVVGRRQGRLVALWPLVMYRKLWWRFIQPLGPDCNPPHDMLVEPGPDVADVVASTWRAMLALARPDLVYLPRIRSGSLLDRCASSSGRVACRLDGTTPAVLPRERAEWPAYCRPRFGRTQKLPDYLRRRIAGQGDVAVAILDHSDNRAESLVGWLRLHKRQWAEHGDIESARLLSDDSWRFLIRLMTQGGRQSQPFCFFVLTLNGVPLAISLLGIRSNSVDLVMNTYDAAYSRLPPGALLIDYCVKWAFDNHFDFNFGTGQHGKQSCGTCVTGATVSLHIVHTHWGLAGYRLRQGARWATGAMTRLLERGGQRRRRGACAGGETESSTSG